MLGSSLRMNHEGCELFRSASFCVSVPQARQPPIARVHVQQTVTDAQPHASFGSCLLFPSAEEGPAQEDIVDLTGQDQVFPCCR